MRSTPFRECGARFLRLNWANEAAGQQHRALIRKQAALLHHVFVMAHLCHGALAEQLGCRFMSGRIVGSVLAAVLAAALLVTPATFASAQSASGDLGPVEVVRYGGADRYETSLLVAEAVAADAGGKLSHVVMVSGRHWYDAVVAAGFAGYAGGPVLMTPPGGVREDALEFLKRVGASQVTVVTTGAWPDTTVSPVVFSALEDAGFTVGRLGGDDRYGTGVSVAEWMTDNQSQSTSGKIAIIANGEVFADALVAGPLAAKRFIPVLLSSKEELHPDVAGFLSDAGIERVVLMGGTAALSKEVENAITAMGISVNRMAGATRFETAIMTGQFAAGHVGGDCFSGTNVGLARARVPFDSFSAAALLARRCAPLVLTDPKAIPASTAGFLDSFRGSAGRDTVNLTVFGGNAAVSQDALNAYLGIEAAPDEDAESDEDAAEPRSALDQLFADAAAQRAKIVKELTAKIDSGAYGIDSDNVLRGPAGFRIDLDDCPSGWSDTAGVTGTQIRIGYSTAQSGFLSVYGLIGTGMENYVDWVNANDPVADRQLVLITKDDAYSAQRTIDNVDAFIEAENVLAITTLGSPGTLATYDRLNDECVPQPFAQTGHPAWGDPVNHPWTTGSQLAYNTETVLWGTWIENNLTGKLPVRVAAVVMDNDFGLAYEEAFEAWAESHPEVVSSFTAVRHDPAAPSLATEMQAVVAANPDVYISMTAGIPCLLAIQAAGSNGLTASIASKGGAMFTPSVCRGVEAYMKPAGTAADDWLVFTGGVKDTTDPRYADEPFVEFLNQNLQASGLDPNNSLTGVGYQFGYPYVEALRIAAELPDGVTRTNLILAVRSLDIEHPLYLDGIRYRLNGNSDAYPVEGSDLARFDAASQQWRTEGPVIDVNGQTPNCHWDPLNGGCR